MPSPSSNIQPIEKNKEAVRPYFSIMGPITKAVNEVQEQIKVLNLALMYGDRDIEALLSEAFEEGYQLGYNDGAEDVYSSRVEVDK